MADLDELTELRADYDTLGLFLMKAEGSASAAIARERRMIRARLNEIGQSSEGTVLDEVAARRESKAVVARVPARRRQPR